MIYFPLQAYNLNTLTDVQRNIVKDLADLGLVKLQKVEFLLDVFQLILRSTCHVIIIRFLLYREGRRAGSYLLNLLPISPVA